MLQEATATNNDNLPSTNEGLPLTAGQQAALMALSAGRTIRAAAASAGVSRNTVSRWMNADPYFRAAYNAWRREVADSTRARLVRAAESAASVVHRAIRDGDGRLALALLKQLGLAHAALPAHTDPLNALHEIMTEQAERDHALSHRDLLAGNSSLKYRVLEDFQALPRPSPPPPAPVAVAVELEPS